MVGNIFFSSHFIGEMSDFYCMHVTF